MKVMVLNNSGNVGKSFIAREMFYYNMKKICDEVNFIEIETHNYASDIFGLDTIKLNAKELKNLYKLILMSDCVIIDVGASNLIEFLKELSKSNIKDIIDEIDYIIIPVTDKLKIQNDTLKMINILIDYDIPKEKIKIIFNAVDNEGEIQDFIEKAKKLIDIDRDLIIPNYQYLNEIEKIKITIHDLANSNKDYKKLAKESYKKGNIEEGDVYADLSLFKGTAESITQKLETLFNKFTALKELKDKK